MSSGGMDWAYRMIAAHNLDPLGVAIVLHLGWRDAVDFRTDRGIAAALGQHRSSVQKATAKLDALGIICRRSGHWVSAETVAIVEETADARRPAVADDPLSSGGRTAKLREVSSDKFGRRGPLSRPAHSVGRGGPLSRPQVAHSVGPKRKENIEKGARGVSRADFPADPSSLSAFVRDGLLTGQTLVVGGVRVKPDAPEWASFMRAVRSQGAENGRAS